VDTTAEKPLLADFGIAIDFRSPEPNSLDPLDLELPLSANGNPRYRAPEVQAGNTYSLSAEVYNFGSVLAELCTGKSPFIDIPYEKLMATRRAGIKPFDLNEVHSVLSSLILRCWSSEPKDRPTFAQIVTTLRQLERSAGV
jgi:serine/threonine protein kinase